MFDAHVLRILLASPSDTGALRDNVERSLHAWNTTRAGAASVILLPRRWETAAVPELDGTDGQTVINRQLVDDADIVIAIFHQTLGSATARAASGTAEELGQASDDGKPVHVYFSKMPIDRDHDRDKLAALDEFRESIESRGLYGSFETAGDLENQVRAAIEHDLGKLRLAAPNVGTNTGASLSAAYDYDRELDNKGRMRTRRERIVVTNAGEVVARDVSVSLTSLEDGQVAPEMWNNDESFTVAPKGGTFTIMILTHSGTANRVKAEFTWTEDGEQKTDSHTLSLA